MSTPQSKNQSVFVGRQPIYTTDMEVYGYELLYRSGEHSTEAGGLDGDIATTQVIINTFLEIGFDNLIGKGQAFINLTRSFIEGIMPIPFPKDRVILEVLEDIPPDPEVIASLRSLAKQGYTIALDDFVYEDRFQPFIDIASVIKIDIQALSQNQLIDHVKRLKVGDRRLLAEKIETLDDFKFCQDLGFDYFQGYFLSRPTVVQGNRLPSSKLAVMNLLSKLQSPAVELSELDTLVRRDASLSYKMLRYINSPSTGLGKTVSSVQQALMLLGVNTLKRWVMLMVMSGVSEKSDELTRLSMIRARMCELIAIDLGESDPESYFITGLFSTLDAMLDVKMEAILGSLSMSDEINNALINREGDLGKVLTCAMSYENGEWEEIHCGQLSEDKIRSHYLSAIAWANDAMDNMLS